MSVFLPNCHVSILCPHTWASMDEIIITPSNVTVYSMLMYCSTGLYKIIIFICNLVSVNNITAIGGGKIYFFELLG